MHMIGHKLLSLLHWCLAATSHLVDLLSTAISRRPAVLLKRENTKALLCLLTLTYPVSGVKSVSVSSDL